MLSSEVCKYSFTFTPPVIPMSNPASLAKLLSGLTPIDKIVRSESICLPLLSTNVFPLFLNSYII